MEKEKGVLDKGLRGVFTSLLHKRPWVNRSVITLTEINCASKQDRDIESVGYGPEGNPVESSEIETPWSDIAPESYTDFLYRLICN